MMFGIKRKNQLLEVFKAFRGSKEDSFSTSLPYYLLTGRKGCRVYAEGETIVIAALHPHEDKKVLVFPEINGSGDLTVKILNNLAQKNAAVQLARYTTEDYQKLKQALERDQLNIISSINIKPETILDWSYPARILDTKVVSNCQGAQFSTLRNKFNKVANDLEEIPLSHPDALKKVRASIFIWAGLIINAGKETGHDMTEFYDQLVKLIVDFPSMFDGFALSYKGEPAGFTIWEEAGDIANGLAGLSRHSIAGMSEFQTIKACQILDAKGIEKYNLGGSETKGLEQFKLKFRPVDTVELSSFEVEFSECYGQEIEELSLVNDQSDLLKFTV